MKKLLTLFYFIPLLINAQTHSCCTMTNSQQFAMLADDPAFAASHIAPEPFVYNAETGKMITIPCADGKDANAFYVKSAKPTNRWLFVFHEWWGLNDYIKQEAEKWQKELGDINVIALDLYDGKVAETPAVAQSLMGGADSNRVRAILKCGLKYTGDAAKIYTLGWCMGGMYSFTQIP